ncbi:hypothetical protein B296_00029136 [Ensete ventricosum]|uniref:Uncharacterized protein n=1 Tax=Ensete ventricosum TaxID=4639 RepID=A0A426XUG6_ENSVE|nr:hypothetical protein B296_00029136 [Ensete ventricosum]
MGRPARSHTVRHHPESSDILYSPIAPGVAPEYVISLFPPQEACLGFLMEALEAWLGSFVGWVCDPTRFVGSHTIVPVRPE